MADFRSRATELRATRPTDRSDMAYAMRWVGSAIDLLLDLIDASVDRVQPKPKKLKKPGNDTDAKRRRGKEQWAKTSPDERARIKAAAAMTRAITRRIREGR